MYGRVIGENFEKIFVNADVSEVAKTSKIDKTNKDDSNANNF